MSGNTSVLSFIGMGYSTISRVVCDLGRQDTHGRFFYLPAIKSYAYTEIYVYLSWFYIEDILFAHVLRYSWLRVVVFHRIL